MSSRDLNQYFRHTVRRIDISGTNLYAKLFPTLKDSDMSGMVDAMYTLTNARTRSDFMSSELPEV